MIQQIHVSGYRSVRDLDLELKPINVLTGPNGCGKSNLYNSLVLMARAAQGQLARAIAEEGGTPSVFWAGGERVRYQRKKPPKRVVLGFEAEKFGYELQIGLPSQNEHALGTMFTLDPRVKEEYIWYIPPPEASKASASNKTSEGNKATDAKRRIAMLKRDEPSAWLRNAEGNMVVYPFQISKHESVLSQIIDPHLYPEISAIRQQVLSWRFYHHFRSDLESPVRQPQIGVYTPVLNHDGSDLAAALQTILEIGDADALRKIVAEAFGGAEVLIEAMDTRFSIQMKIPGLLRPLQAQEFSDGQVRFLCLCAALLSPRPPSLLAVNEPETSLHPDILDALAHLIVRASKNTQLWITTHSQPLADRIEKHSSVPRVRLHMSDGETQVKP
ncbi:MAG TPA: AAA family ATPase [Candidatus Acidoferrum sp.]|nr:AAA family ATPase [Candidatus Acidoferrum sp.]